MKPKISIVSLTVSDLNRALAFYRDGLGFPTHNYTDGDDYILFKLEGSWLSLMARDDTAKDLPAGVPAVSRVGLSHNVASPTAVHEVFDLGLAAGATALKPPQPAPWAAMRPPSPTRTGMSGTSRTIRSPI